MKNIDLLEIRNRIDEIDSKLVELLEERLNIVEEVAMFKKQTGKKIFDEVREKEVIDKNIKKVKNKDLEHYMKMIIQDIMDVSKEYPYVLLNLNENYKFTAHNIVNYTKKIIKINHEYKNNKAKYTNVVKVQI